MQPAPDEHRARSPAVLAFFLFDLKVTKLSSGCQRKPLATVDRPSDVLRMNATCSGRAPSKVASSSRVLSFRSESYQIIVRLPAQTIANSRQAIGRVAHECNLLRTSTEQGRQQFSRSFFSI